MKFIQRSVEMKWPILLIELILLIGGILLIVSGVRIRNQSKSSAFISVLGGASILIVSAFLLFWTFIFGYNS